GAPREAIEARPRRESNDAEFCQAPGSSRTNPLTAHLISIPALASGRSVVAGPASWLEGCPCDLPEPITDLPAPTTWPSGYRAGLRRPKWRVPPPGSNHLKYRQESSGARQWVSQRSMLRR